MRQAGQVGFPFHARCLDWTSPSGAADDDQKKATRLDIGKKLQAVRKARGLSQRELASRAGLTNGTISLIEKNKTSPSIASLKRLLDAIPMSMSEFFSSLEDDAAPRFFYRADEFIELVPQDIGLAGKGAALLCLRQLGDSSRHSLQVLHETYPPGGDTGAELLSHEGEEAGIVIHGTIEITVDDQVRNLGPGDGYMFDSRLPHRFRNPGTEHCVIVSACTPPSF
jgi:transcriptional regulator with XRE-family HTH domain